MTSLNPTRDPAAGLCANCLHARRIQSDRGAVFYLCELSATDSRFSKYPRLPVLTCPGYASRDSDAAHNGSPKPPETV